MSESWPNRGASVLLAFRASNVRSFRDEFEFSMLATAMAEPDVVRQVAWRDGGRAVGVLPAAGIFGANASGKSNVLRSLADMRALVVSSFRRSNATGRIARSPFRLDAQSSALPSRFEIDIILDDVRHEYGFVVDDQRVREEWAFRYPKGRAALIFRREGDDVEIGSIDKVRGRALAGLIRPDALYLSTAAAGRYPPLAPLFQWFERNLRMASEQNRSARQFATIELMDGDLRPTILKLLEAADLGLSGAKRIDPDPDEYEPLVRAVRLMDELGDDEIDIAEISRHVLRRLVLSHHGAVGEVDLSADEESVGTLVWVGLIGPVAQALADGAVLLVDEIDTSLHPLLVAAIVKLFQSHTTNPRRAQIIFNAHDASLLGDSSQERLLGRDQIWFTEKVRDGSSRLFPLSDLDPRREEAVARRYLRGRYGATPIISDAEFESAIVGLAQPATTG